MTELLSRINDLLLNLSMEQVISLFLFILALSIAASVVKKGMSVLFSFIGILSAIYFIDPQLYSLAKGIVATTIKSLVGS